MLYIRHPMTTVAMATLRPPLLQGQQRVAILKSAKNLLLLILEASDVKPSCWKSLPGNVLM